jgi:hypothetical protein
MLQNKQLLPYTATAYVSIIKKIKIMQQDIITNLDSALGETINLLEGFDSAELNKIPFKDSWTAAQVGEHLYKSEVGIDQLFTAPAEKANRQPDERAAELKKILLDYTIKMDAPEFLIPEEKDYNKDSLLQALREAKATAMEAIANAELDTIAPLQDGHPLLGSTKLEIVHFMVYHAQRHNHQLTKIKESLNSNT